jgi:hypothetical protein
MQTWKINHSHAFLAAWIYLALMVLPKTGWYTALSSHLFVTYALQPLTPAPRTDTTQYLPKDPKNHSAGFLNISCDTANYVCKKGPSYEFMDAFFEPDANASTYP